MPDPVSIRLPLPMRVYVGVFAVVWLSGVGRGLVDVFPRPETLVLVVMLAFGATLVYRNLRLDVVANADGLLVRNHFRTRRYGWHEVEDFRLGSPGFGLPFGKVLYALLATGDVTTLDVTMRWGLTASSRKNIAAYLDALRRWATHGTP